MVVIVTSTLFTLKKNPKPTMKPHKIIAKPVEEPSDEEVFSTENHIFVRGKKALGNNQVWPSWSEYTPTTAASAHTQRIPKSGQQCDTGLHHHLIPLSCYSCPWSDWLNMFWVRLTDFPWTYSSLHANLSQQKSTGMKPNSAHPGLHTQVLVTLKLSWRMQSSPSHLGKRTKVGLKNFSC